MALAHLERLCCPRYRPAERDFLPELWEAFQYKDKRSDRLWKRDATLEANLRSLVEGLEAALDFIHTPYPCDTLTQSLHQVQVALLICLHRDEDFVRR